MNFKKAFDSISHDKLWVTMMDIVYPLHLIELLAKLEIRCPDVEVSTQWQSWLCNNKGISNLYFTR